MSKQKKKKTNTHHLEKVAKAQHKNEYIRKLRKVLNAIGCSHIYELLPSDEFDWLYKLRCQSIQIVIAPGDFMPPGKLKWIKRLLSAMLKRYEIPLLPDGALIDLDTYFTAGMTLLLYGNTITFEDYPKAAQVKEALMPYLLDRKYKNQAYVHLKQIAETIGLMLSDPIKRVYWATVNLDTTTNKNNYAYKMVWHSAIPEKRYVPIDKEFHTIFRLGKVRYQSGPAWIIYVAGHNIPNADNQKDVTVYLQSHVLTRLYERLDCIPKETVYSEFLKSMENFNARCDNETDRIFVDMRIYNVKVGYLLATVFNNKLILRTFLFITLQGTPEGIALRKNAKLKRDEVTFLELDRLSTFMTPEIQHNKHIKQFFIEAGLQPLFELYEILKDKNIALTKHANTTLIEDFLGIDLTREFLDEDDEIDDNNKNIDEDDDKIEQNDGNIGDEPSAIEHKEAKKAEPDKQIQETLPSSKDKPRKSSDANAALKKIPKKFWWKKIVVYFILFIMRSIGLLVPFLNKSSEHNGKSKSGDDDTIIRIDKTDDFSPSHFSPSGRIFGWIFMIFLGIPSYLVYFLVSFPFLYFRKGKKKRRIKIDYKQFLTGRNRKRKKK
jgi:hypothetical protein